MFTVEVGQMKGFKNLLKFFILGNRILGSSGFEHVFLGEKKNGTVQGRRHFFLIEC